MTDAIITTTRESPGIKIRKIRKLQHLNLVQLAERCNISPSFLSQIERNLANPSVSTLYKIADVLGVSIATLVSESQNEQPEIQISQTSDTTVVRADQRKVILYPGSGIRNELLTTDFRRSIQLMWVVMPVGTDTGEIPFSHEGEECGVILQGTLETWVGEEKFILGPGDSIYHNSTIPHRSRNIGDDEAIIVVSKTPPSIVI